MIIQSFTVGCDKWGYPLICGDICKYKINKKEYRGMIIYDEDSYAFAFEQLDNQFPIIMMDKIDYGTIEKLLNIRDINPEFSDCNKWIDLYNANLFSLEHIKTK